MKRLHLFLFVLILFLGSYLRLTGVYPGFHPNHSDENFMYSNAIEMWRHTSIEPFRYEYPALTPIINIVAFNMIFIPVLWFKLLILNFPHIISRQIHLPLDPKDVDRLWRIEIIGERDINTLFWTRTTTALFGAGIIILTYFVARKMFGKTAGLFSALLVAINYRQVLNSHFALPDIYNGFFLLLAFFGILYIWQTKKLQQYIFTGIAIGCAIATKYQPFIFIPFLLIHLPKVKNLFQARVLLVPLIAFLVFAITNPHFFIHLEQARNEIAYAGTKYAAGRNVFDFYSYFYLFKIGIGPFTTILSLVGIIIGIIKYRDKTLLLLSLLVPFFYFWTYYSSGGFYTRNYVSITPFILVFAGLCLSYLFTIRKPLLTLLLLVFLAPAIYENISKSLVVTQEYQQPWNREVINQHIISKIPTGSKISAHSSVPLTEAYNRLPFEIDESYSIDEFLNDGADYAIANLDWITVDAYWWMRQPTLQSFNYFNKPIDVMKYNYRTLAVNELAQYTTFSAINNAYAPDSDYIAAKLPRFSVVRTEEIFRLQPSDWKRSTENEESQRILTNHDDSIVIKNDVPTDQTLRWISKPIDISEWNGFEIVFEMKNDGGNKKEGFLLIELYDDLNSAPIGTRLSSRNVVFNKWNSKNVIGEVPSNARYMTISFKAYNYHNADLYLRNVVVYNADVKANLNGVEVHNLKINENNLYPNSHGNL